MKQPPLPKIWAQGREDSKWHVAERTHPATADTACARRITATRFALEPSDCEHKPALCEKCAKAGT